MSELDNWIKVIDKTGFTGWQRFYESSLGQPVSNIEYFKWAIDTYGQWPVIQAILAAKRKNIQEDSINYVVAVAQIKWRETFIATDDAEKYKRGIERAKQVTTIRNEELEEKLERAKRAVSNGIQESTE